MTVINQNINLAPVYNQMVNDPRPSDARSTGIMIAGHPIFASMSGTTAETNCRLRQTLLNAACEALGVRSFDDLPPSVKSAFKVGKFKDDMKIVDGQVTSYRPLTARRIQAVAAAITRELRSDAISLAFANRCIAEGPSPSTLGLTRKEYNFWMQTLQQEQLPNMQAFQYAQRKTDEHFMQGLSSLTLISQQNPPTFPQMGYQPQPQMQQNVEYVQPEADEPEQVTYENNANVYDGVQLPEQQNAEDVQQADEEPDEVNPYNLMEDDNVSVKPNDVAEKDEDLEPDDTINKDVAQSQIDEQEIDEDRPYSNWYQSNKE